LKPKERLEEKELINKLFQIFEQSTYYDLRALALATRQSSVWLREVLNKMCIYNKRGPHKGMYELKPQFKHANKLANSTPITTDQPNVNK